MNKWKEKKNERLIRVTVAKTWYVEKEITHRKRNEWTNEWMNEWGEIMRGENNCIKHRARQENDRLENEIKRY